MVARFVHAVARLSAPLGRIVAGRRFLTVWVLIEFPGRKSGKRYRIPLATRRTATGFLFPIPFGHATQWPLNVLAAGGCAIQWNGRPLAGIDPQIVGPDVALPAFNAFERPILRAMRTDRFLSVRIAPRS